MVTPWSNGPRSGAVGGDTAPIAGLAGGSALSQGVRLSPDDGLPALHVLVVDDDDTVRNACCEIARKMGFVVVSSPDLDGARQILKHHKVDLLLLDLKLAGARGLTLLEEVKILHAETSVAPFQLASTVVPPPLPTCAATAGSVFGFPLHGAR